MSIFETLRTAIGAVLGNKLRSALTTLGIVIGVAAVIALSGLGEGVTTSISGQIESIGSNVIMIVAKQDRNRMREAVLTMRDAEALANPLNVPAVSAVAPVVQFPATVVRGQTSETYTVMGSTEDLDDIMSINPAMGGFLTAADVADRARVVVLGWDVYVDLFGEGVYPIQQYVTIDGTRYTVVGVAAQQGGMMGSDRNLWMPITTAQSRHYRSQTLSGENRLAMILAKAVSQDKTTQAKAEITATLRRQHDLRENDANDFSIMAQEDILDMTNQIMNTLTLFLGAIAGISLLVGGIGIMNIMLVTVTERTREIGIRKAIGAQSSAILAQFIVEALVLTMLGGFAGMALGSWAAETLGTMLQVQPVITPQVLALAAGVSIMVGLVFGTYPAARAARLNPIEALRHE
ncbi:MAG: ABC transporter permease [Anaerolineales bacterium]